MQIQGEVREIIFRNEENGYSVFLFAPENSFSVITCVGSFFKLHEGETLMLEGEYVQDAKYGRQFKAESYDVVIPTTVKGIEKYLASGLIRGVGAKKAKDIVQKFGINTLHIIEFNPQKLKQVSGIGEITAEKIHCSLIEQKEMQNAILFLQKYEITTGIAIKIYETYREKTVSVVSDNPYQLVEDVDGIGFSRADKIAASMGIDKNSAFRARAGILHVIGEAAEKNGNTFVYRPQVLSETAALLQIPESGFEKIFDDVVLTLETCGMVKTFWATEDGEKKPIVMLAKYYHLEKSVAGKMAKMLIHSAENNYDISSEISAFEQAKTIRFHESQRQAIFASFNSGVSVITGGPGTGKTTIVSCLLSVLKRFGKRFMLLAPTGRAAKRLSESTGEEAKTIHRGLEIDFRSRGGKFVYNDENQLNTDVVIVDEVSMVDISLMNALLKALPHNCQLILIGDKDQLPSVGAGNVLADILQSGIVRVSELTKIFRQDEGSIITMNAHRINSGEMPLVQNKSSKDFFFEEKSELEEVYQSVVEMAAERIPSFLKIEPVQIQVLAPLKAGICGILHLNAALQARLNPPDSRHKTELKYGEITFREGDKIMQIANNYDMEWVRKTSSRLEVGSGVFNGDIGYIHKIHSHTGEMEIWFEDEREANYTRADLEQLSLAYAITIHKSQGCEFDVVVMPVIAGARTILTRNLLYTAITRAKKMVALVGSSENLRRMVKNTYTQKRSTMLKPFLIEAMQKAKSLFG